MTNRFIGIGRLTRDVELKFTPSGVAVASFTIAINRTFKNQQGEYEADFINVVAFKKLAENVANYTQKGSLVAVEGRIQTRSYENKQGQRVYVTEIIADSVQFLEPKSKAGTNTRENTQNADTSQNNANNDMFNGAPINIDDDDLPF